MVQTVSEEVLTKLLQNKNYILQNVFILKDQTCEMSGGGEIKETNMGTDKKAQRGIKMQ